MCKIYLYTYIYISVMLDKPIYVSIRPSIYLKQLPIPAALGGIGGSIDESGGESAGFFNHDQHFLLMTPALSN